MKDSLSSTDLAIFLTHKVELPLYQEVFYYEWMLNPSSDKYNLLWDQTLTGDLDIARLNGSMIRLVNEYLLIGSNIVSELDKLYWVRRALLTDDSLLIEYYENGLSDQQIKELVSRPFDLEKDLLFRGYVIKIEDKKYRVLFIVPHIVMDGSKGNVFMIEAGNYYNNITYKNPVSLEEQERLISVFSSNANELVLKNKIKMHEFWSGHLQDISAIDLRFLESGENFYSNNGSASINKISEHLFSIEGVEVAKVGQLKRICRLTPYSYSQLVFAVLLHRMSGQKDIGITYPVAIPGADELIYGSQVNSIIFSYRFNDDLTVAELVKNVIEFVKGLKQSNARFLPVGDIAQHVDINNVQSVGFVQRAFAALPIQLDGMTLLQVNRNMEVHIYNKFVFEIEPKSNCLAFRVRYDQDAYDSYLVKQFVSIYCELFRHLLEDIINDHQHQKISNYQLLTKEQHRQVLYKWNDTYKTWPSHKTIQELFAEQVEHTPDNIALVYEGTQLTYRQLNERSNRLAHYLREKYDIRPDDLVALCLDRSEHLLVAILGVLKSGGAYVPIDPGYPDERIGYMLSDTGARVVLTNTAHEERIREITEGRTGAIEGIDGEASEEKLYGYPLSNPIIDTRPDHLAYVIYTSGTTGKPKGIMVEHGNVVKLVINVDYISIDANDVFLQLSSVLFDASTFEIWAPLLNGGRLVLIKDVLELTSDAEVLKRFLLHHKVTILWLTKTLFDSLYVTDNGIFNSLNSVLTGGEVLNKQLIDAITNQSERPVHVINGYGPTETTTFATTYVCNKDHQATVSTIPIGRPISNTTAYVLDGNLQPLPVGAVGELYIGGAGVARGYLNREELTRERFISNPFQTDEQKAKGINGRLYKTGDLVRYLPDGNLEYIGRNDFQVKIRGYRIEPGEIEARLASYSNVKQAVVLAKEQSSGTKYLIGYYVSEEELDEEAILKHLSSELPEYMVPSVLVHLAKLPLTVNGKLDRYALPDPDFTDTTLYEAPANDTEAKLCMLYGDVLDLNSNRIGVNDDFFRLGGSSISAIRLVNRINKELGTNVRVAAIFTHKTIKEVAAHLFEESLGAVKITAPVVMSAEEQLLSFAQERLWFIEQYEGGSNVYTIPMVYKIRKSVNIESLLLSLQRIINRHEVLRSLIKTNAAGKGYQQVQDDHIIPLSISRVELFSQQELQRALTEASSHVFKPDQEYPVQVKLYSVQANNERADYISIVIHHIAFDGWSIDILMRELISYYDYYEAIRQGDRTKAERFELPVLKVQYKEYALWQRAYLQGEVLEQQLSYWKQKLSGYETLTLMTDKPRPARISYEGKNLYFELDGQTSNDLREVARQLGVSLYSVLLSGYYLLLSVYSNQRDIVVGTPIANRHHRETEDTIGFFVNTLALRSLINSDQDLNEFIEQVGKSIIEAQLHQDLPFEKLVSELQVEQDSSRHPIFQVMFSLQNFETVPGRETDRLFEICEDNKEYEIAKFDITTMLDDSREVIRGVLNYAISLFKEETMASYIATYKEILAQIATLKS